jgi:tetratricopeptide (TPR) repeat protein
MSDPNTLFAQATADYNQGKWQQSFDLAISLLPVAPQHAGLHYLIGLAAFGLKRMPQALDGLQRAVQLAPGRGDYLAQLAKVLSTMNRLADALAVVDRALLLPGLDAPTLDTLGVVLSRANAHDRASMLYRQAVDLAPEHADFRHNLAKALTFRGDLEAAERELDICIDKAPQSWYVHLTLAQLRRQTAERNHIQRLEKLLPATTQIPVGQMNLHLSLSKEYEDLADYPKAFEHLVAGKQAGRRLFHYRFEQDEAMFAALIRATQHITAESDGFSTAEPIFVLGMPRSGTTLVERILSSHPDVHSAGELQLFPVAFKELSASKTPRLLDADTIERAVRMDWSRLGETYLANTRPSTGHTPRFVDKLPHNFLYAGFIAKALPRAKILCLRRNPMDTCVSNFRQLFMPGSNHGDYSFDLLDTGRYYVQFDRLMAHWHSLFPGRILDVEYETLVESQEPSTRRLLEFCELPWNEACLHFEDNPSPTATASAVQVRQPMNRRSIGRWKNYETHTIALQALLTEHGLSLGRW